MVTGRIASASTVSATSTHLRRRGSNRRTDADGLEQVKQSTDATKEEEEGEKTRSEKIIHARNESEREDGDGGGEEEEADRPRTLADADVIEAMYQTER